MPHAAICRWAFDKGIRESFFTVDSPSLAGRAVASPRPGHYGRKLVMHRDLHVTHFVCRPLASLRSGDDLRLPAQGAIRVNLTKIFGQDRRQRVAITRLQAARGLLSDPIRQRAPRVEIFSREKRLCASTVGR